MMKKTLFFTMLFALASAFTFAESVTIKVGGSNETFDLPSDVANLVRQNQAQIETELEKHNITKDQVQSAVGELNNIYSSMSYQPLGVSTKGLDNFSEDLAASIANAQLMQNVWAEAWIGKLIPGFHMGIGVNVGAAELKIDTLKETAKALEIDSMNDLPNSFAFPTVAADLRLGGILLPFDVGVSYMTIDSTKISKLNTAISPLSFDFYTIGVDARWAICQGKGLAPKISIGAGYVYTKGGVNIDGDEANAGLNFTSKNIYAQAQISKKLLFIVPFAGAKLSYVKSDVNWNVNAHWANILDGNTSELGNLEEWEILPKNFSGGYNDTNLIPQVYGGIGLDLFVINLNVAVGYDFSNKLLSAAANFRIAW